MMQALGQGGLDVSEDLDEAVAQYQRGVALKRITEATGVGAARLYQELAARGIAPSRVQRSRLINRDTGELVKEAWDRLAACGAELARANRNNADMAARIVALTEQCDHWQRLYEASQIEAGPTTPRGVKKTRK